MYYSYSCPVCSKVFYTFNDYQQKAAETLYYGVEKHMKDYGESTRDYTLDHPDKVYEDIQTVYSNLVATQDVPSGAYELE